MMLHFIKDYDRYEFHGSYDERHIPKRAGFSWDSSSKVWWTKSTYKASLLLDHTDDACLRRIKTEIKKQRASLLLSRSQGSSVSVSKKPEDLEYFPFQKVGIQYAASRPNTLIADQMGLGKTIQAIGLINHRKSIKSVLVVCPAGVKFVWQYELNRWLARDMDVGVAYPKYDFPNTNIVIMNYEILHRFDEVVLRKWDLLICDEAHYIKNSKTQRSKMVKKVAQRAKRLLFLTGTPILSRPSELWNLLRILDPDNWDHWLDFIQRYCDGHRKWISNTDTVWDASGASNLDELQKRLRSTIMIRRLKEEVLEDLPSKFRQTIIIPQGDIPEMAKIEKSIDKSDLDLVIDFMSTGGASSALTRLVKVRKETALAKVPWTVNHIKQMLESEDKVVIFAHHKAVVEALVLGLVDFNPVWITGDVSLKDREVAIASFQANDLNRVFIGTIGAAGVGITLTAASTVVFAELDWVPGNISQAEDRLHRIGQHNNVLVQHLVVHRSIDAVLTDMLTEKQKVIDAALDLKRK
jgi:SWI/SNF-related matrix-associated actin-dependent regulator 1 of chromatin subfamily A